MSHLWAELKLASLCPVGYGLRRTVVCRPAGGEPAARRVQPADAPASLQ
jgi:hypothetical protein